MRTGRTISCDRFLSGKDATVLLTGHEEKSADYYDGIYRQGYDTSGYRPLYDVVLGLIRQARSPRVLELGCGIGDLGRMIIDEGFPYRGFDFSAEAIEQCLSLCSDGNFTVGDIYDAGNYRPVDYNTVVALEVLEQELVPPGGRFIASVPDYDDEAHLRLYRDIQRDIVERFRPYLHIVDVATASTDDAAPGIRRSIHIFSAIRILP